MKLDLNPKLAIQSPALYSLPLNIATQLLSVNHTLGVMNRWAKNSYGILFWEGGYDFNPRFRVVYDGSVHMSWRPPFAIPCVWLEFEPFGVPERSAKFGLAKWMKKPLLDPGSTR